MVMKRFKVRQHERGLLFRDGVFEALLGPGRHWRFDALGRLKLEVVSVRKVLLAHADLDVIAASGALADDAKVLDLKDRERALVWRDGRFACVLGPGVYALWTAFHKVAVEVVDVGQARFTHPHLETILQAPGAAEHLNAHMLEPGHAGVLFIDGRHRDTLGAGRHAFWKGGGKVTLHAVDLREQVVDVSGQEIMTADKVTLRLNAVVAFRVVDPVKAVTLVQDHRQALYREAQLALRAIVGTRELDPLLADKDALGEALEGALHKAAAAFGVQVVRLGIRDVILPGEMKELLNKVTEARKAAEAAVITRREETAAMRSQANTARLLDQTPTLMRLRELEVLERVADKANLTFVLGEQGLKDRVVKLL